MFSPFDKNLSAFRVAEVVESRLSNVRKNSLFPATISQNEFLAAWKNSGRPMNGIASGGELIGVHNRHWKVAVAWQGSRPQIHCHFAAFIAHNVIVNCKFSFTPLT